MTSSMTKAAAMAAAGALAAGAPALALTQTENIVAEQRTSVSLRVKPEAAQAFLPAGWTVAAAPGAPNLTLIFMDRKLALTPDGKPLQSGVNRLLVLSISARNTATGQVRGLIVGGYSTDPQGVPGAYKVYAPGAVTVARTERTQAAGGKEQVTVEEHWTATGADGATVKLDLAFARGVPTLGGFEQQIYSGADPEFHRTYRGQQASEVLRGPGVDKVQSVKLSAKGGKLGAAIDGTQQIVTISQAPYYARLTFVQ